MPRQVRGVEHPLHPVDITHPFRIVGTEPQPAGEPTEDLVVGLRFPDRLDALGLEGDDPVVDLGMEMGAIPAGVRPFADVVALHAGAGRQDHVGEARVALLPDGLADNELQVGRPVHFHIAVGIAERAQDSRPVAVEHPDRRMAFLGVTNRCELPLHGQRVPEETLGMSIDDRVGKPESRNLLGRGIHRRQLRHTLVERGRQSGVIQITGDATLGITRKIEAEVERHAQLEVADIDAGLAKPLHAHQADKHPGPLAARRIPRRAAERVAHAAGREIGAFGCPLARQRADVLGRHTGLRLLPLRAFRDPVLDTHDVVPPGIKALGPGRHILLVVAIFRDPDMGDRERKRGRGRRPGRDPLAAEKLRGVVVVGIDVDDLDINVAQPLAADRTFLPAIDATGRLRVARPEDNHLGILEAVLDGPERFAAADPKAAAPVM